MTSVKRERGESSHRGGGERGADVEDAEELLPNEEAHVTDRRMLRSRYRELKTDVQGRKSKLAQVDARDFKEIVERVESLHKYVSKTREQITDAELLSEMTSELYDVAKVSCTKGGMSSAEFVGAIIHNFGMPGAGIEDPGHNLDWEALGLHACTVLLDAPGVSTMIGPMDVQIKPRKVPINRRRDRPTEKTRPEEVNEVNADRPSTETDANMTTMFKILSESQQVEIARLIFNRVSFAQTVENLFALSFLVKDGRVEIGFSEDGNQFATPRNAPSHADRADGEVLNTQFVFRLDYRCWRSMQETLSESAEGMPHRGGVDQSTDMHSNARTPIRKNSRNRARETPTLAPQTEDGEDDLGAGSSRRLKRRLNDFGGD